MKPRVCAVSYLNTTPLVWGLLHGPQQGAVDLRFEIPSKCADALRCGEADIGLAPSIELQRQALERIPSLGIASYGKVRSILLVSKTPAERIRSLSLDESSRTSVVLARVLLKERFGVTPKTVEAEPHLEAMLERTDAALLIGDPALRLDPMRCESLSVYDLGAVWSEWTGLPMVYAVWAAREGFDWSAAAEALRGSYEFGRGRIAEIAASESAGRGITEAEGCRYLTTNIHFELGDAHERGLREFWRLARTVGEV